MLVFTCPSLSDSLLKGACHELNSFFSFSNSCSHKFFRVQKLFAHAPFSHFIAVSFAPCKYRPLSFIVTTPFVDVLYTRLFAIKCRTIVGTKQKPLHRFSCFAFPQAARYWRVQIRKASNLKKLLLLPFFLRQRGRRALTRNRPPLFRL